MTAGTGFSNSLGFTPQLNDRIINKTTATYALMVADGTPTITTLYKVTTDENKGITNATYIWFPDGIRMWVASTID